MMDTPRPAGWVHRLLGCLEHWGNRLPHPALLFALLCLAVLLASTLLSLPGVSATHPVTQDSITVRNLLSGDGIRYMLGSLITNFTGFAPLGIAIVALLGIGVAERSGLLGAALTALVGVAPQGLLVPVVAFAGVMSSIAMDAGYVVLIPLAGLLFQLAGRHPLAGIATAFAGVSGGFSANLLIGPVDAILAGLSTEAARLAAPEATVSASANYWFLVASTLLVTLLVTLVTRRWIEPWLSGQAAAVVAPRTPVFTDRRPLRLAGFSVLIMVALLLALTLPANAPLRNPEGGLIPSPLVSSSVVLIALIAAVAGIVYGKASGSFRHSTDVVEAMEETLRSLSGYLVLMFFAAQFVAWFNWSNIGIVLAIHGADWLGGLALPQVAVLVLMVLFTALLNLMIGSASAKWGLLAPVFVPMLLLLGISPEATQAAYRVGDSTTNIISPLMPYFVLVLGFVRRYQADAGVGTLVTLMLPYSLIMLCGWSLLLALWLGMGWPLGF
ncbi:AbgT putative transporter family protein [Isoalcanivorax pacificus W11-5]|uniref:AbgT putative transporter family protein n=1 Tax=Isoalcanivorax pacificus W11-5 TaxID=391936 RepID=A0A0B4XMG4_9GAMM|nr:AbgT family transporter [Isoalcanivorax pacificus]AJD47840.1 AbgT putative transporter family protein [Isoalcanivorax pacificus W11-5]